MNATPVPSPRLIEHTVLDRAPALVEDGSVHAALAAAHSAAVDAARERLGHAVSIPLDPTSVEPTSSDLAEDVETINDPGATAGLALPRLGRLLGYRPFDPHPIDTVRRAIQGAWGPGNERAHLVATEYAIVLDADVGVERIDPRSAATLLKRLGEGWQLQVSQPFGLPLHLQQFLDDLAMVFGGVDATLVFGVHSALGAPSNALPGARVIVQLAGARSILLQHDGDQNQLRLDVGSVLYVPQGQVVSHLPLDLDTLHLDIALPTEDAERPAAVLAMVAPRLSGDYRAAHAVISADPEQGWPMRLLAPGGAQLVSVAEDRAVVVVGARQLVVDHVGLQALTALAKGSFLSAAELAEQIGAEATAVVAFCEELWALGLLDPAIPADPILSRTGERLTQVASTIIDDNELRRHLLGVIDESAWARADDEAVHHGPSLEVAVQPVTGDGASAVVGQLADIAASMNQQFFGTDVDRLDPNDPPLFVRVRPSSAVSADPAPHGRSGLGSDLAGKHSDRKVTFVYSLSSAEGGWVRLPAGSDSAVSDEGGVSAWASFRPWTLSPMSEGERLFLIGRLHGPAFR